jgi:hypothetical protein
MITGYIKPQLTIRQLLERVPNIPQTILSAFIIGPQYDLRRYTNEAEREAMLGTVFQYNDVAGEENRQVVAFEDLNEGTEVDEDFVKLYGEKLEAKLTTLSSMALADEGGSETDGDLRIRMVDNDPTRLKFERYDGGSLAWADLNVGDPDNPSNLPAVFNGRELKVGDIIYTSNSLNTEQTRRTVVDFERSPLAAALGTTRDANDEIGAASPTNAKHTYFYTATTTGGTGAVIAMFVAPDGTSAGEIIIDGGTGYSADDTLTFEGEGTDRVLTLVAENLTDGVITDLTDITETEVGSGYTADLSRITSSSVNIASITSGEVHIAAGTWSGNKTGALVDGEFGETYTLTCTKSGKLNQSGTGEAAQFTLTSASGKSGTATKLVPLGDEKGYIVAPNDVLSGIVVQITKESAVDLDADTQVWEGETVTFTVKTQYRAPDVTNAAEADRDISFGIAGSQYTGVDDTTYLLSVSKGTDHRAIPAMKILSYDNVTKQLTVDMNHHTEAERALINLFTQQAGPDQYYTKGIFANYSFPADIRFKASGTSGVIDLVTSDGSTPISGLSDAYVVAITGDNVYLELLQDPAETLFASDHPVFGTDRSATPTEVGTVLTITDTEGTMTSPGSVTLTESGAGSAAFSVAKGIAAQVRGDFQVPGLQVGYRKGDTYTVNAWGAKETGEMNIVQLSGQAADISGWTSTQKTNVRFNTDIRIAYNGEVPAYDSAVQAQYSVTDTGIAVEPQVKVQVNEFADVNDSWLELGGAELRYTDGANNLYFGGRLFAHYRAFVPAPAGNEIKLYSVVPDEAGAVDLDNPFAYGLSRALSGSQGRPVYAATVESDDVAGYTAVLRQAENIEGIYAISPVTEDRSVQLAVRDHVNAMSTETKKLWRRAYVSTESPGVYMVASVGTDSNTLKAKILDHPDGVLRVVSDNSSFISSGVQPNYTVRINISTANDGTQTYDEYPIRSVLDEGELLLISGPDTEVGVSTRIEIWANDTARTQAEYVGAISKSFGSRRVANIWAERPTVIRLDGTRATCPVKYAAAECAGLRTALFPQEGLTRTQILSFASIPSMYTRYTDAELDIAAREGTFIITQEKPGGAIFVRHQLTTDSINGLLYYEDSVGTNLDFISYRVKAILASYVGKRNANPQTVQEIRTKLRGLLRSFLSSPAGQELVGPALIDFRNLFVEIDPNSVDRIVVNVTLVLPAPLNYLDVTLNGNTFDGTVVTTAA